MRGQRQHPPTAGTGGCEGLGPRAWRRRGTTTGEFRNRLRPKKWPRFRTGHTGSVVRDVNGKRGILRWQWEGPGRITWTWENATQQVRPFVPPHLESQNPQTEGGDVTVRNQTSPWVRGAAAVAEVGAEIAAACATVTAATWKVMKVLPKVGGRALVPSIFIFKSMMPSVPDYSDPDWKYNLGT